MTYTHTQHTRDLHTHIQEKDDVGICVSTQESIARSISKEIAAHRTHILALEGVCEYVLFCREIIPELNRCILCVFSVCHLLYCVLLITYSGFADGKKFFTHLTISHPPCSK